MVHKENVDTHNTLETINNKNSFKVCKNIYLLNVIIICLLKKLQSMIYQLLKNYLAFEYQTAIQNQDVCSHYTREIKFKCSQVII